MRGKAVLLLACMIVLSGISACLSTQPATSTQVNTMAPPVVQEMPTALPTPIVRTEVPGEGGSAGDQPDLMPVETPDPVEAAVEVLSHTLGIDPASITVGETLPVQWTDSSLGCPDPDKVYLQVVTPGYLITLVVGESIYSVHTDLGGTAIVCEAEGDPIGVGTVSDPVAAEFVQQARADLAGRLEISPDDIDLLLSEPAEWMDSSIGCGIAEGEMVAQVITVGYRILLGVGEDLYEYHTDQHRLMYCENPVE
jgi:hypothetical protein